MEGQMTILSGDTYQDTISVNISSNFLSRHILVTSSNLCKNRVTYVELSMVRHLTEKKNTLSTLGHYYL